MKELELKYGCNPNQKPSRIKSRQDINGCRMAGFKGIRGKGGD